MTEGAAGKYSASIPSLKKGTVVNYYVEAINVSDIKKVSPVNAPTNKLSYTVGDPSIVINEIFSQGTNDNPDWIELYNKSNNPVNISAYRIYDSGGQTAVKPKMEIAAGTIIPAKSYLVVVVDDAGTANPNGSNFGISSNGEEIWLESSAGYVIDDVVLPAISQATVSYGRNPDGSANWQLQNLVTKNAPNTSTAPIISNLLALPVNPSSSESVLVSATITDNDGISSVKLYYNVEGSTFNTLTMVASGNIYSASIPAQPGGSKINYYIEATDIYSLTSYSPSTAPAIPANYTVASSSAITNFTRDKSNPTALETVMVSADVTDPSGLSVVKLYYKTESSSYSSVTMTANGNNYSANIPIYPGGTVVSYYIEATNTSNEKTYAPANALSSPETYSVVGPILINEIFARGTKDVSPDWIEIYNLSNAPIDISAYKIYDSNGQSGNIPKMQIPAGTTLPANGYYVIDVDVTNTDGSGFGLSNGGEDVWLENAGGTVIDHILFGATAVGESYGRKPDGTSEWIIFTSITKGSANP